MRKAINHLKKSDPVLAAIIARVGPYALEAREPTFGTLVRSIVYQPKNHFQTPLCPFSILNHQMIVSPILPGAMFRNI